MHRQPPLRSRRKTLRVQADVPHTFGPLLIPFAILLLAWGGIQLEHSVTHPLESDLAPILFGSVVFASGLLLVSYFLRSVRISSSAQAESQTKEAKMEAAPRVSRRTEVFPKPAPPPSRPFHGFYVDDTRVSS